MNKLQGQGQRDFGPAIQKSFPDFSESLSGRQTLYSSLKNFCWYPGTDVPL